MKSRKAYCCATDLAHEPIQFINFYETVKELKSKKLCWNECGIVKVKLKVTKVIKRGKS